MKSRNINVNESQYFDGTIEQIIVENDLHNITIVIKQWNSDDTHTLSKLKFHKVVFQSLPEIFSFNLINEITTEAEIDFALSMLDEYLEENKTLKLPNTRDQILNDIRKLSTPRSFTLKSPYTSDWLIVCNELSLSEEIKDNTLTEKY